MINTEKLVINKKVYETIRKARHVHEFYTYKDKPVDKEVMKDLYTISIPTGCNVIITILLMILKKKYHTNF